jgi:hypothetical protein
MIGDRKSEYLGKKCGDVMGEITGVEDCPGTLRRLEWKDLEVK